MTSNESTLILKPGREKPIENHHPWVFSGAIRTLEGEPAPGDILIVRRHDGMFLGRGYWNPQSQIQLRMLTWHDEPIDEGWWRRALQRAIATRQLHNQRLDVDTAAYRLINAENDYLPGLVVDRYGDWLVLQALTLGIDIRKKTIASILADLLAPRGIYERSDVEVREKEGLRETTGVLWGDAPPDKVVIDEGWQMLVDIYAGHKTGHYLDQADNRRGVFDMVSSVLDGQVNLLNLFSYTGGFGLAALAVGGVHVVNVDSSADALALAEANAALNDFDGTHGESADYIQADVFTFVRAQVAAGTTYDIVVCDPPKFAHSKNQVDRASRGYKDINLHAFQLVKPGGYLLTFSCSGAISADLFQKIVFGALADSGRDAQILAHLGAGYDHPVALTFPEGSYLKGLLLRVY